MSGRYGGMEESVWEARITNGELCLYDDEGDFQFAAPITRKSSRTISELAFTQGATHVRFNFDLVLIEN